MKNSTQSSTVSKSGKSSLALVVSVALISLIAAILVSEVGSGRVYELIGSLISIHALPSLLGLLAQLVAFVEMMRSAGRRSPLADFVPWITVMLAGTMLVTQCWSLGVAMGGIGVAIIVTKCIEARHSDRSEAS